MKLFARIAWRYFKAKKSVQAINIISWISIGAIAVSSAAMIILFSVFNGLDHTIKQSYTSFNPELKITPKRGKFFTLNPRKKQALQAIKGMATLSETIEDMALLSNGKVQRATMIKGVDKNWFAVSAIDSFMMKTGNVTPWAVSGHHTPAMISLAIANYLSIDVQNPFSELQVFYPRPSAIINMNPETALSQLILKPNQLFHVQQQVDDKYTVVPLQAAQLLFSQPGKISAVELKVQDPSALQRIQNAVKKIMGNDFTVANRLQQNKSLYNVLKGEKWMVYLILLFVLLIASFNLTGGLYMLVWEKKRDISILKSLGMEQKSVRYIFLTEGVLLSLVGVVIGIVIGFLICLGQQKFGWVSLPNGFIVSAYPVAFEKSDFILVFVTVVVIGTLASLYPALKASRQPMFLREE